MKACYSWLVLEFLFAIFLYCGYVISQQLVILPQTFSKSIFGRILDNIESFDTSYLEFFFCGWLGEKSLEFVRRGNYRELVCWIMYSAQYSTLRKDKAEAANLALDDLCDRLKMSNKDIKPEHGYNKDIKHIHAQHQSFLKVYEPLFVYLIRELRIFLLDKLLGIRGYQWRKYKMLKYWYRPCSNADGPSAVFFLGTTKNAWAVDRQLVQLLSASTSSYREVFLVELEGMKPHSFSFELPRPDSFMEAVGKLMDRHKVGKLHVVGHGWGAVPAGWFTKAFPGRIHHLSLIDPASLLLCTPRTSYAFLYALPASLVEWVAFLGAPREVTVANAARRNLWWYKSELWLEGLSPAIGVHVSLQGCAPDECGSDKVCAYVKACGARREQLRAQYESLGESSVVLIRDVVLSIRGEEVKTKKVVDLRQFASIIAAEQKMCVKAKCS